MAPERGVPRWLILVAAGTAVLAAATFVTVAFWPVSEADPTRPVAFAPFTEAGRIEFGEDAEPVFTDIHGGRAYVAATVGEDLEVVATDLALAAEMWRQRLTGAEELRWRAIGANDQVVVVLGETFDREVPQPLIVLDARTGEPLWREDINDGYLMVRDDVVAFADGQRAEVVGRDLSGGQVIWTVAFPVGEFSSEVRMVPVYTAADLAGPSELDGRPERRADDRVVMVGSDRSARLIDVSTGEVRWTRGNVADPGDLLLAYQDTLFVAEDAGGYQILAYDLRTESGQPRTLYAAPDPERRPVRLVACGQDRLCLLDRTGFDSATTEVAVVGTADEVGQRWRKPAPASDRLLPIGASLLAGGGDAPLVWFGPDGTERFERTGFGVRLNAGNLLVFAAEPTGYRDDISLAGYPAGSGERVELGPLAGVRGEGCSWGGVYLVCPAAAEAGIWRFAPAP